MEDQGIIDLFFERSEQAITETDKKYGGYCYAIAYNILSSREDSEESVSDTYLTAWNTIPPRKPNILSAFLGKITRHISIDRWRKQSAQKRGGKEDRYYGFYRCGAEEAEFIEKVVRDPYTLYWGHAFAGQDGKTIREDQAWEIINSYKHIDLTMKSFTEYPLR